MSAWHCRTMTHGRADCHKPVRGAKDLAFHHLIRLVTAFFVPTRTRDMTFSNSSSATNGITINLGFLIKNTGSSGLNINPQKDSCKAQEFIHTSGPTKQGANKSSSVACSFFARSSCLAGGGLRPSCTTQPVSLACQWMTSRESDNQCSP